MSVRNIAAVIGIVAGSVALFTAGLLTGHSVDPAIVVHNHTHTITKVRTRTCFISQLRGLV